MKKRTASESKESYEGTWNDALEILETDIVNKEKELTASLENLLRKKVHSRFKKKSFRDIHKKLGITVKRNQVPNRRLVVQNSHYAIVPIETILDYHYIDILAEFIHERKNRIDCVVELGSGIGINLFLLAYKLDPVLRKRIRFFSCEVTDAGRTACEKLLGFSDELNMSIEHFDYYHPDFSFLEPNKNVLFFTAHSIEQIPKIDRSVFERMIAVSNECHCFHAEPVGWQYDEELRKKRKDLKPNHWKQKRSKLRQKLLKVDRALFSRFGIGIVDNSNKDGIRVDKTDIGKPDNISANALLYSFVHDYNTNLVPILKKMEVEDLIGIDTEMVNLCGKNPFNPSTIISWHKIVK
jgi:hypothetical protein